MIIVINRRRDRERESKRGEKRILVGIVYKLTDTLTPFLSSLSKIPVTKRTAKDGNRLEGFFARPARDIDALLVRGRTNIYMYIFW